MSALTVDPAPGHGQEWDDLDDPLDDLHLAALGCVRLLPDPDDVSPPPSRDHNLTAARLQRSLYGVIPEDWEIFQTLGVSVPGRAGLYIPDLVVVPDSVVIGPGNRIPAEEARLVVEITSQANADHDRIRKVQGYAKAGVALFLLLDPWHSGRPTATLYGEPDNGTYRVLDTVEYGGKLTLPEPFGLDLDTGMFPVS
ncbi:Uma2 family endonuclease [Streptomyces sp. NPDC088135]|uniref:Uma2 family endonuclease n=1 Tax=Streptomyces sp. NPDC088135 TaxID=3160993 RepID=UPI00342E7F44